MRVGLIYIAWWAFKDGDSVGNGLPFIEAYCCELLHTNWIPEITKLLSNVLFIPYKALSGSFERVTTEKCYMQVLSRKNPLLRDTEVQPYTENSNFSRLLSAHRNVFFKYAQYTYFFFTIMFIVCF